MSSFIFLFLCLLSNVYSADNFSQQITENVGKGLSGQVPLTGQEQDWLNKKHRVRVRISEFPPHMMTHPEPRGISVDYLKLIGKRFGINFDFVKASIPWKESVEDLEGNRLWYDLLITMKKTPERERKIVFTQDYLFAPWVIVNRTESPYVARMEDLNNRIVAVERGYVIEGLIKENYPLVKMVYVTNALDALNSVASGTADAYVGNLPVASYLIQSGGLHNLKIAAPTPFGNHNQAMGIRSDWPELAGIINKALTAMPEAEKSEITSRWFAVKYDHGITAQKILSWVVGPIAILSLIIVVIVSWNRRLKREIVSRVTAEKLLLEANQKITERELELRTIIETEPECINQIAQDGSLLSMNRAGLEMIEADSIGQVLGKKVQSMLLPGYRDAFEELTKKVFSGESGMLEFEIQGIKGGHRWLETHAVPFRNAENQITALLGVTRDITERKKAVIERESVLRRVKKLEGIIPICMYCKKIRDDENSWNQLEQYITEHSEAKFSHGICPHCVKKAMESPHE